MLDGHVSFSLVLLFFPEAIFPIHYFFSIVIIASYLVVSSCSVFLCHHHCCSWYSRHTEYADTVSLYTWMGKNTPHSQRSKDTCCGYLAYENFLLSLLFLICSSLIIFEILAVGSLWFSLSSWYFLFVAQKGGHVNAPRSGKRSQPSRAAGKSKLGLRPNPNVGLELMT